jgi:thiol:disulfide interchange protein DsbD
VLGATVMFTLAHGQGLALVALGVGAGFLLPKVGPWMETIKHVSGALLIAVAIYLLGTLPEIPVLLLWGVFFIVCGVYLGATQRLPDSANGWRYLWKGLGTVLLIWGVVALLGGFAGNRDALNPLPLQFLGSAGVDTESKGNAEVRFTRVHSVSDLERHLALAKTAGKPVFIEYFADWCTDCVRMDGTTFRDPQVGKDLEPFVVLRADVTETDSAATQSLKKRFGVYAPPAMVLIDATGQQRGKIAYGYQSAGDLLALLRRI